VAHLDVISASGPPSWAVATWKSQSAENTEKYYVIGWVQREGEYKFRDGLKIGGAIDAAGGLRVRQGTLVISVQRRVNGTKLIVEVDFNDPVHPRDVINVAYENK